MQFDEKFLDEMGLSTMPAEKKPKFLSYLQDKLELTVGERISNNLTEAQLNEFDLITDQAIATKWLDKNCPNHREIVSDTIKELKAEIIANRSRLLA